MAINFAKEKDASAKIMQAMKSGDEKQIQEAWKAFHKSVADQVIADFEMVQQSNDANILAQRGYRQLTSQETKWYQKLITALKSDNPKQHSPRLSAPTKSPTLCPPPSLRMCTRTLSRSTLF